MKSWPSPRTRFLPSARECRVAVAVCCLLTWLAGFDAQLLLASPGLLTPSTLPSQENTDDEDMLSLTCATSPQRALRRNPRPPGPTAFLPIASNKPGRALSSHRQQPLDSPACEHAYRNGIGTPLLC